MRINNVSFAKAGQNQRQSNMEALRIIAMSMILIYHFMCHGLHSSNIAYIYYPLKSFVFGGVNIFFLISGFFSIRYSYKGIIRLIILTALFGVVNLLAAVFFGSDITLKDCLNIIIYPLSGSPYWFIKIYYLLYLTSPIINAGLQHLRKNELRNVLVVLVVAILYMKGPSASYNYLQSFYLYCVGFYLGRYGIFTKVKNGYWLLLFFVSCLISSIGYCISIKTGVERLYKYYDSYANIFTVFAAISLVIYFSRLKLSSGIVNSIASASLGCYLLQDGWFGIKYFYDWQTDFLLSHGLGWKLAVMLVLSFLGLWILSFILTSFMNLWIKPFSTWLESVVFNILGKIRNNRCVKGIFKQLQ